MKTKMAASIAVGFATLMSLMPAPSRAETVYFLMSGPVSVSATSSKAAESYVVAVSDEALIQRARSYLAAGRGAPFLVPQVRIALGPDDANRNYAEPGHPLWDWHATELIGWTTYDPSLPVAAVYLPRFHTSPSRVVPELLTRTEMTEPADQMSLLYFPLMMELSPGVPSVVANVSTRGWVGTGQRVMIAGFVVDGGTPRNLVVRGIGPSLSAFGVEEALADPRITVYRGSEKIAENDNWAEGNLLRPPVRQTFVAEPPPWYEWLFPTNTKEAALRLLLSPGAYTVHLSGAAGGTGIALVEVYDFDALAPN